MTRINVIHPLGLSRQHLVAEYRELPRIFGKVQLHVANCLSPSDLPIPPQYCLGKGHMMFFYDKLQFLDDRYLDIIDEMLRRGYKPQYQQSMYSLHHNIPSPWWGDYQPTTEAVALNQQRIRERS